jgi:hypothetical protein
MGVLEARLIPGTGAPNLTSPFFSPDGESVGYWQDGQLKRIAVSGGAPVVICAATNPFGVSWGPDNTILFGQPAGIMRVSATGGTPELVIPAVDGEVIYGPQLLPSGVSVLFTVTKATGVTRWEQAQIVVQPVGTRERKAVLAGGSDARYVPTDHLVYAQGNAWMVRAHSRRCCKPHSENGMGRSRQTDAGWPTNPTSRAVGDLRAPVPGV